LNLKDVRQLGSVRLRLDAVLPGNRQHAFDVFEGEPVSGLELNPSTTLRGQNPVSNSSSGREQTAGGR
jgi:hypothetical protein